MTPFMMGTTSSITMQSLRKIAKCAPAVGAKMWCLFFVCYRQDAAKRQTAGIKFTHWPKIRFFAPQWRLVEPIHVKQQGRQAHGSAWLRKISPQSQQGVGMRPQKYKKKIHFW